MFYLLSLEQGICETLISQVLRVDAVVEKVKARLAESVA
jgi:hypothetical protein